MVIIEFRLCVNMILKIFCSSFWAGIAEYFVLGMGMRWLCRKGFSLQHTYTKHTCLHIYKSSSRISIISVTCLPGETFQYRYRSFCSRCGWKWDGSFQGTKIVVWFGTYLCVCMYLPFRYNPLVWMVILSTLTARGMGQYLLDRGIYSWPPPMAECSNGRLYGVLLWKWINMSGRM